METLAAQDSNQMLDTELYLIAAKLWLNHADKDSRTSGRKAIEIVNRAPFPNESLVFVAIAAAVKDPLADATMESLNLLEMHWDELSQDKLPYYAETAARVMASSKLSSRIIPLCKFFSTKGVLSHTPACSPFLAPPTRTTLCTCSNCSSRLAWT
jgi:hypothetical protein